MAELLQNIITFIDNHVKTLSKYFKMRYTVIYLGEKLR